MTGIVVWLVASPEPCLGRRPVRAPLSAMPTNRRVLTREDARRIVAEQCIVPSAPPRIGLELEFLTFATADARLAPTSAADAAAADPLASGGRVTCEPGGQLEVSSPPRSAAAAAIAVATADARRLDRCARGRIGIELLAVGADRWRPPRSCRDVAAAIDAHGGALRRVGSSRAPDDVQHRGAADQRRCAGATRRSSAGAWPTTSARRCSPPSPTHRTAAAGVQRACGHGSAWSRRAPVRSAGRLPGAWADYALAAPALVGRTEGGGCVPLPAAMLVRRVDRRRPLDRATRPPTTCATTSRCCSRRYGHAVARDPLPRRAAVTVVGGRRARGRRAARRQRCARRRTGAVAGTETLWREAARYGLDDERLAHAADRCFAIGARRDGRAGGRSTTSSATSPGGCRRGRDRRSSSPSSTRSAAVRSP